MPTYKIKNTDTEEEFEVFCSYNDYKKLLDENSNYKRIYGAPSLLSGTKDTLSRTPDGFRDVLKNMKSGSGYGNTIKVK